MVTASSLRTTIFSKGNGSKDTRFQGCRLRKEVLMMGTFNTTKNRASEYLTGTMGPINTLGSGRMG